MSNSWFDDKVCYCEMAGLPKVDWKEIVQFKHPLRCTKCDKWLNNLFRCYLCNETFYQFFAHPRMGCHPHKGWACWNCLERHNPPIVQPAIRDKIPPPVEILPPGYEIYIPPPIELKSAAKVKSVLDDFDAFLKGL